MGQTHHGWWWCWAGSLEGVRRADVLAQQASAAEERELGVLSWEEKPACGCGWRCWLVK